MFFLNFDEIATVSQCQSCVCFCYHDNKGMWIWSPNSPTLKTELLRVHCNTLCGVIVLTSDRFLGPGCERCVSMYHTSFIRPQFPPGSVSVSSSWTFGCARSAFCQTRIQILTLAAVSGTFVLIATVKALLAAPEHSCQFFDHLVAPWTELVMLKTLSAVAC